MVSATASDKNLAFTFREGESLDCYSQRVGLPRKRIIHLHEIRDFTFVLIPAGDFRMGFELPQKPELPLFLGIIIFTISLLIAFAMVIRILIRIRKERHSKTIKYTLLELCIFCGWLGLAAYGLNIEQKLSIAWNEYNLLEKRYDEVCMEEERINITSLPAHKVKISQPYYLAETTKEQWDFIMHGSTVAPKVQKDRPIDDISWTECQEFIEKLKKFTGMKGLRLPTEAEWERACKAGGNDWYYFGNNWDKIDQYAWTAFNLKNVGRLPPIGKKIPNDWGLYDMHGSVAEYCSDWYGPFSGNNTRIDPKGPPAGDAKVVKGGAVISNLSTLRSSSRWLRDIQYPHQLCGFRLVLSIEP
jgi:hypothetical protein